MNIREYREEDRKQVVALWKDIFPITSLHNDPDFVISKKVQYDGKNFFVAVEGTDILGTVMAGYDGHRGWIYSLAVREDSRRLDIGRKLVKRTECELKKLGCAKINLQILASNEGVAEFYKKLGFQIEERISMGKIL